MIMEQKIFKNTYLKQIKRDLEDELSLEKYKQTAFEYDSSQTIDLMGIEKPEGLAEKLLLEPMNDAKNAIYVYEAYENLSPVLASKEALWAYLCHVDLFEYVKARWETKGLLSHFFLGNHKLVSNAISRLWWGVYYSIDNQYNDKYELTRVLFESQQLHDSIMMSAIGRYKPATLGILDFFRKYRKLNTRDNNIAALKVFNRIGGAKLLSSLPRVYFTEKLEAHFSEEIKKIHAD